MDKVPMSRLGYSALELELKRRTSEDRPSIVQAISDARAHGDLSENAEYHAAKEAQSLNEGRIQELEGLLSRAEVIDIASMAGDTIKFGAKVKLLDEETNDESQYQILGTEEADVSSGKISVSSPLSRALIGKEVGDSVEVTTPGGVKSYEILNLSYEE